MKFTIGTAQMSAIMSKVQKGVGNNKIMPITEYAHIILYPNGNLVVTGTDTANFIIYIQKDVKGEEGEVIVQADKLNKLVARTTKPSMTFTKMDGYLEVKGNGTYKVPTLEGEEFPQWSFDETAERITAPTADLKKMFGVNKSAIANEMLMPCLTGYNLGGKACVTTDGIKMCINTGVHLFEGKNMLVTPILAELVSTLSEETVVVQKDGNKLLFSTSNIVVFGAELEGIDQYPDVMGITGIEYPYTVKLNKSETINALDRLELFANPFDNHAVRLAFGAKSVTISDLNKQSFEVHNYVEGSTPVAPADVIECLVNVSFFQDLLSSLAGESVDISFADGAPLKLVDGNIIEILGTMQEPAKVEGEAGQATEGAE